MTLITDAPITDDVPYNGRFFKAPTVRYKAQGVYWRCTSPFPACFGFIAFKPYEYLITFDSTSPEREREW